MDSLGDGQNAPTQRTHVRYMELKRFLWPTIALLLGLAITGVAYRNARDAQDRRVERDFNLRASWRALDFQEKLLDTQDALTATAVFVSKTESFTNKEFQHFAAGINASHRPIAAIDWVPRVTRGQRETFEAVAKQSGLPGFQITELDDEGRRVTARDRPEYFPVLMQWQFQPFNSVLGFDTGSEITRSSVQARARDTGMPVATTPLQGIASNVQNSYFIFWPIYDGSDIPATVAERRLKLRGYVLGVFRSLAVLNAALENTPEITESIEFYAGSAGSKTNFAGAKSPLAVFAPAENKILAPAEAHNNPLSSFQTTRTFDVMGVEWRLDSRFAPQVNAAQRSTGPVTILIAGLLLTCLFSVYVVRENRLRSRIQGIVNDRTRELQESEASLNEAQRNAQIGSWRYVPDGKFFWSNQMYELFKLPRSTVPSLDAVETVIHPEDRTGRGFGRALESGALRYTDEYRVVWPDGQVRTMYSLGNIQRDVNSRVTEAFGTVQDVTDQKRREQAEHELTERLKALIDNSAEGVILIDDRGVVLMFNPAAEQLFGYAAEEIIGCNVKMLMPSPYAIEHDRYLEDYRRTKERKIIGIGREAIGRRKDGSIFPIRLAVGEAAQGGKPIFIGNVHDLSEQKARESALLETQILLAGIVSSSDDAIISKTLEGIVTTWNKAAERIFGYSAEEMIGQRISVIAVPGREDDLITILDKIKRGERVEHYETQRRRKDGVILDISLTVSPIHDARGQIIGASKVARDITDTKKAAAAHLESEALYRDTFNEAPIGIVHGTLNGRCSLANETFCKMTGYDREEVLTKTISDFGIALERRHSLAHRTSFNGPVPQAFQEGYGNRPNILIVL